MPVQFKSQRYIMDAVGINASKRTKWKLKNINLAGFVKESATTFILVNKDEGSVGMENVFRCLYYK